MARDGNTNGNNDVPSEPILEPALPIIDSHHHLRDATAHRYLFPEFIANVMTGHNIVATVAVETQAMYRATGPAEMKPVGETEFFNGIAAMCASGLYGPARGCAAIVGFTDLNLGSRVQPVLEAHIAAAGGRFRGIRNLAVWDAYEPLMRKRPILPIPPGTLLDPMFRQGFACLERYNLSFDTYVYHPQLMDLIDLAGAFPNITIIMEHVGGPLGIGPYAGKRDEIFIFWKACMREIARYPNIVVKLGGMAMPQMGFSFGEQPFQASSLELANAWRPYIETCIEFFGPPRCMFESNFPSEGEVCRYPILWNAFKRIAAHYSDGEKADLFSETARRVYRLPEFP